jgi:hypothetical protein
VLTVVVVSMGKRTNGAHNLRSELSLTRSSALYADHVLLLSPYTAVVQQIAHELVGKTTPSPPEILEALKLQRPDLYHALRAEHEPDVLLRTLIATVQMQAEVPSVAASLEEIGRAGATGFLSTLNVTSDMTPQSMVKATTDRLFELLLDPSVHVVCDGKASEVLGGLAAESDERLSASFTRRNREAELGAGLIARLPAFPDAPLSELLEVKAELKSPLERYRAAVAKMERELPQDVFAAALDPEIEMTWRAYVAPALTELKESLIDHGFVRELARSLGRSVKDLVLAGAALSIAVANVAHIAASAAAVAGLGGAAAQVVASATLGHLAHRQEATRADLFYLQELSRRIDAAVPHV